MTTLTEELIRIGLAVLIGGLIGAEREYRDKAAGFRTMIFITLGSTLFTMLSLRLGGADDPVRITANIVTGIGFIGAGAILRGDRGVTGLTTAATIWLAAALGLGVGSGALELIAVATVTVLIVLWIFPFLERWIDRIQHTRHYEVVIKPSDEKIQFIEQLFKQNKIHIHQHRYCRQNGTYNLFWLTSGKPNQHENVTQILFHDPEILEFKY